MPCRVSSRTSSTAASDSEVNTLGWITTIALAVGFGYLGLARPVKQGHESRLHWINTNKWFVVLCILPLTVAGFGFSIFWAKAADPAMHYLLYDARWWGVACALAMVLAPCAIYYARYSLASFAERRQSAKRTGIFATLHKAGVEALGAFVGLVTAAGLLYVLAAKVFPNPLMAVPDPADYPLADRINMPLPMGEIFVCFAVPLVLIVFFVQASTSSASPAKSTKTTTASGGDARGALLLMSAVILGCGCFISVFGPVLLYRAPVHPRLHRRRVRHRWPAFSASAPRRPPTTRRRQKRASPRRRAALASRWPCRSSSLVLLAAISLGTTVADPTVRRPESPGDDEVDEAVPVQRHAHAATRRSGPKFETKYETEERRSSRWHGQRRPASQDRPRHHRWDLPADPRPCRWPRSCCRASSA